MNTRLDRRSFLQAGGAGAILCVLGDQVIEVKTQKDVDKVDAAAAAIKKPVSAKEPVDSSKFPTPEPQPGGQVREYWIAARSVRWNIVPTGFDQWHNRKVGGKSTFNALVYRLYTEGFATPLTKPSMPGPVMTAEVGDVIRCHFRNADERFNQALTLHPHGVKYNPEYDGAYLGAFTRAGGFIAPGEEFTYTWECTPESVGVWPYHDHGPNHTLNSFRGLFGAIIVRPKGAPAPDVEQVLVFHSFAPQVTGGLPRNFQAVNGRSFVGNTPTIRAKAGQRVAIHAIGGDNMYHTFHLHGHRWKDPNGTFVDDPGFGPNEVVTAQFTEDNPGRWLWHCHVFSHQDMGMAGWYIASP
jgi:manganese oxidase